MRALLSILALLTVGLQSHAGQLGLKCGGLHPQATEVRYYVGDREAPLATAAPGEDVVLEDVPDACVEREYTCTQVVTIDGTSVESARSPASRSAARPRIFSVVMTDTGVQQIIGDNFTEGVELELDGELRPVTLKTCQLLETADEPFLELTLTAPPHGLDVTYTLPIPAPDAPVFN